MKLTIQVAEKGQARDCLSCLEHSELWDTYFKSNPTAENDIEEMIGRKQIYLALDQDRNCIGFMGIIHHGCFHRFSYLSLIAVAKDYRNKGVGKQLLGTFEETGFRQANRVFLLVSDFNQKAQLLYRKSGYHKVGSIPDLFKEGISEQILVKYNS